jgi:hypothetical protein
MDKNNNDKQENLSHKASYSNTDTNVEIDSDKIIPVDNAGVQPYGSNKADYDENNKLANIPTANTALNPFAAALDVWQGYLKSWNNAYKQLLFSNPPMTNGEFWFMYCRFDSKSTEKQGKNNG